MLIKTEMEERLEKDRKNAVKKETEGKGEERKERENYVTGGKETKRAVGKVKREEIEVRKNHNKPKIT